MTFPISLLSLNPRCPPGMQTPGASVGPKAYPQKMYAEKNRNAPLEHSAYAMEAPTSYAQTASSHSAPTVLYLLVTVDRAELVYRQPWMSTMNTYSSLMAERHRSPRMERSSTQLAVPP